MIYGKNTTSLGNYDVESVVAEEGYNGVVGSLQIMTESYINEGKMFKYLIEKDFQEAVDIKNGVFTAYWKAFYIRYLNILHSFI